MEYPKSIVKSANERLRKLERGYTAKLPKEKGGGSMRIKPETSAEYRKVQEYYDRQTTTGKVKAPIYKADSTGFGIRFISKSEFEQLDEEGQKYFLDILNQFMDSSTSTVTGIVAFYEKAYEGFMRGYGQKYPDMKMEEYIRLFSAYADILEDKETHKGYDYLSQIFQWLDIPKILDDNAIEETMYKVSRGQWHLIDKKHFLHN